MEGGKTMLESILEPYRITIGEDFERYTNHATRVYLFCRLLDPTQENEAKYAIAAAFHDIGIWTAGTFDYLDPSVGQALDYLETIGQTAWAAEIKRMIDCHHKVKSYTGEYAQTVQAFRKADWIDVSRGLLTFGIPRSTIESILKEIPNRGFHSFLLRQSGRYFLKHPWRPLPMFRI
ncbi:hypothetical protein [Flavobacterium sp.]|uniref:hypothetical protein n=1 Tax=Flavobacterium sp. TaxID=239 RepID=UPI0039E3EA65